MGRTGAAYLRQVLAPYISGHSFYKVGSTLLHPFQAPFPSSAFEADGLNLLAEGDTQKLISEDEPRSFP